MKKSLMTLITLPLLTLTMGTYAGSWKQELVINNAGLSGATFRISADLGHASPTSSVHLNRGEKFTAQFETSTYFSSCFNMYQNNWWNCDTGQIDIDMWDGDSLTQCRVNYKGGGQSHFFRIGTNNVSAIPEENGCQHINFSEDDCGKANCLTLR